MPIADYFNRRFRIFLLISASLLLAYGLLVGLALPALLRQQLEKQASALLHRHVRVGKIEINPFLLRVTLRDVAVVERSGPFLRFAALTVDAELASLWRRGPVLREITLDRPEVRIVRLDADHYNFSDLLEGKPKQDRQTDSPLPRFALNNIRILGGKLDFEDRWQNTHQRISELQLALPFVSTLPYALDQYIEPGLSGKFNDASFKLVGQTKPFKDSRETRLTFSLDGLELPQYLAYLPLPKDVSLTSGRLSGKLGIVFREDRNQPKLLLEGQLNLRDALLDYRNQPLLSLPGFSVEMRDMEPLAQKFRFSRIVLELPTISISSRAGKSNWQAAFPPGKTEPVAQEKPAPSTWLEIGQFDIDRARIEWIGSKKLPALQLAAFKVNGMALDTAKRQITIEKVSAEQLALNLVLEKTGLDLLALLPPKPPTVPESKSAEPAWRIKLNKLALMNSALRLEDQRQGKTPPLALSELSLTAAGIDTGSKTSAQLDFASRAGKRGQIRLSGPFVAQPFSAHWQTEISTFDAAFIQSYLAPYLNIQLASIWLAAKGEAQVDTVPKLLVRYRGNLAVNDFHAIDKLNGADFLKWHALTLHGIDVQSEPLRLDLNEIRLADFYSRLILSAQGRLNVQDILAREGETTSITRETASAPTGKKTPLPPIRIGKIVLANGNVNYSDHFIRPNFNANLQDMAGTISGLSSKDSARASVNLQGSIDRIAPVSITGNLNPLAQQTYLDIKASVKGYELTAASTYSGKYAGYDIDKGKLSLDLAYYIENGALKASNRLVLDQLTLGKKVDSPEATQLPVRFALALLTDRNGVIDINLPVEGSLNDPQFRVGKIIWQVLVNLLEKAVTAPFSALSSLLGGDEASYSRVEFEPGLAVLGANARESLNKLARALSERPGLQLEIAGWIDRDVDTTGLKRQRLEEKLRARKLAEQTKSGLSVDAVENLSASERSRLLEQVYLQENFAKPRNATGLVAPQSTVEMERLILANIRIDESELRQLALQRAIAARDAVQHAGVAEARLFILAPHLDPEPEALRKEGGKATRAQFALK